MDYRKYDKASQQPFRLSRSKIENFTRCPRCFYLEVARGVAQPPGFPFTLNSAVDYLLKKEFDIYRKKQEPHPLMTKNHIAAVPFQHPDLETWRDSRRGLSHLDPTTNFMVFGALDDIWVNEQQELIVVDYKATSKSSPINLDADWQMSYKRQVEVYQWLLRQNGFKVSNTSYFVYCNGLKDRKTFDNKLEFAIKVIPYVGDDAWIEPKLQAIKANLTQEQIPGPTSTCDFCNYQKQLVKQK